MNRQDRLAIMAAIIGAGREIASAIYTVTGTAGEYDDIPAGVAIELDQSVQDNRDDD